MPLSQLLISLSWRVVLCNVADCGWSAAVCCSVVVFGSRVMQVTLSGALSTRTKLSRLVPVAQTLVAYLICRSARSQEVDLSPPFMRKLMAKVSRSSI